MLRNLSLSVDKDEFMFFTGPSGAGKSTFFRLLLHEELPTEGNFKVAGLDLKIAWSLTGPDLPSYSGLRLPGFSSHPAVVRLSQRFFCDASAGRAAGRAAVQDVSGPEVGRPSASNERIRVGGLGSRSRGRLANDLHLVLANEPHHRDRRHAHELIRRVGRQAITLDQGRVVEVT